MIHYRAILAICMAISSVPAIAAGHATRAKHKAHHSARIKSVRIKKININQAKVEDLTKLKGMSVYKAHAIVAYRKKHGKFKNFANLSKVKGFKRMKAEKMKIFTEHLSV